MNAINFIQQCGFEKVREVFEGAPEDATGVFYYGNTEIRHYFKNEGANVYCWDFRAGWWLDEDAPLKTCVDLSELKRLVESVDLINSVQVLGRTGYDEVKSHIENCDPNWCYFHYKKWKQAIADYESIGGEHV